MARPKEFDVAEALAAATDAFWDRGYEATSMQDLMEVMGLHKGSIYNSFGDKHELFVTCLVGYLDTGYQKIAESIASEASAIAGLKNAFRAVQGTSCDPSRKGCLGMNTVAELVPHDGIVTQLVDQHFTKVATLVTKTIARGQADGELRSDVDPLEMTKFLMTLNAGLLTGSKSFLVPGDMDSMLDMVFNCLS